MKRQPRQQQCGGGGGGSGSAAAAPAAAPAASAAPADPFVLHNTQLVMYYSRSITVKTTIQRSPRIVELLPFCARRQYEAAAAVAAVAAGSSTAVCISFFFPRLSLIVQRSPRPASGTPF